MHSSRMRTVRSSGRLWGGGWCLLRGVSARGGVSDPGGVSAPGRGVSAPGRGVSAPGGRGCLGGVCSGGVSALRGCLLGGCLLRGWGIPACTEADTPPPVWTDTRL